jgi:hypothetical protein
MAFAMGERVEVRVRPDALQPAYQSVLRDLPVTSGYDCIETSIDFLSN